MSKKKSIKKGDAPSKEEAESALNIIKLSEKDNKKEIEDKAEEARARALMEEKQEIEKAKILEAQNLVRRRIRENIQKKEEQELMSKAINFLESGNKIKWKTNNSGKLSGYVNEKLVFEIVRGLTVFNLYVKDKKLMEDKKIKKSYIGCSTQLQILKSKSEKLV